jgi:hypothetical protein
MTSFQIFSFLRPSMDISDQGLRILHVARCDLLPLSCYVVFDSRRRFLLPKCIQITHGPSGQTPSCVSYASPTAGQHLLQATQGQPFVPVHYYPSQGQPKIPQVRRLRIRAGIE